MYGENITVLDGVIVSVFCIVTVFFVLLVISYLIDLTHWLCQKLEGRKQRPVESVENEQTSAAPERVDHIDAVLVAAAIAAYTGKSQNEFIVRSIKPVTETERAWQQTSRGAQEG